MNLTKNDPKVIRSWAMYDWANSAYPLVITTAIFPIYYQAKTSTTLPDGSTYDIVSFFGYQFVNTELYSYVFSLSFLIVSFISPFLSGISDYTGQKKNFLKFFCYLGALGCSSLFFFNPEHLELSMSAVLLASVGFWGSLVFYNAYLPEIATPDMHDKVSAKGFAYGYLGSSLLLIGNLVLIQTGLMPAKYAFLTVALWWAGFAQVTYSVLPNNVFGKSIDPRDPIVWRGYQELKSVWMELQSLKRLRRFLQSFFVYSMGVQTVMLMAVLFADKEIEWVEGDKSGLIVSVLIIQFIAILGAHLFARLSARFGNIKVLGVALIIWVGVCLVAYVISQPMEFYILAGVVGLVMGGIQALSRSTYSKMLPATQDHASYFSFYDVLEKLGIVVGTFLFGIIEGVTHSMRYSALALTVFFLIGLLLLFFVPNVNTKSSKK